MNSSVGSAVPTIKCEDASPSPMPTDGEPAVGSYNLSVNLSAAVINLLSAENAGTSLRTPEIVNDVITMTNPLDEFVQFTDKSTEFKSACGDSNSSMSNGSSATSPSSGALTSVQKTCSELIKAGLKLSIESKRKMSGSDTDATVKRFKKEDSDDDDYDSSHTSSNKNEGLTPEDEERRRRRRERNKIAATKCRMKKRERTVNLVTESEVLESQNIDLKAQLKDLEVQKSQLIDMLSVHASSCVKNNNNNNTRLSPPETYNIVHTSTFPSYDTSSPYIRPESANILASSYQCINPIGDSSIDTISSIDTVYIPQQMIENDYRPESLAGLHNLTEHYNTDGYLPKSTNFLVPVDNVEQEYYESEVNYNINNQQCHNYQGNIPDNNQKLNNGLNDVCLV